MEYFYQCKLEKQNGDETITLVSWIPEKGAIQGKSIRIKRDSGWDYGWVVKEKGSRADEKEVEFFSREYKKWRSVTDI